MLLKCDSFSFLISSFFFRCEDTVISFDLIFLLLDLFSSVVTRRKVFLVSFFEFLRGYYVIDNRKKICSHLSLIYCTSQYNYNFSNLHVTEMKQGQENIKLKRENISKQVVVD